jgi:hypothetical protein
MEDWRGLHGKACIGVDYVSRRSRQQSAMIALAQTMGDPPSRVPLTEDSATIIETTDANCVRFTRLKPTAYRHRGVHPRTGHLCWQCISRPAVAFTFVEERVEVLRGFRVFAVSATRRAKRST